MRMAFLGSDIQLRRYSKMTYIIFGAWMFAVDVGLTDNCGEDQYSLIRNKLVCTGRHGHAKVGLVNKGHSS